MSLNPKVPINLQEVRNLQEICDLMLPAASSDLSLVCWGCVFGREPKYEIEQQFRRKNITIMPAPPKENMKLLASP